MVQEPLYNQTTIDFILIFVYVYTTMVQEPLYNQTTIDFYSQFHVCVVLKKNVQFSINIRVVVWSIYKGYYHTIGLETRSVEKPDSAISDLLHSSSIPYDIWLVTLLMHTVQYLTCCTPL